MYGGSGTWPSASTASATVRPGGRPQPHAPAAVKPPLQDLALERRAIALEHHARAGLQLLAGMHERVPLFRAGRPSTGRPVPISRHSTAPPLGTRRPMQPGGKHLGVVHDQQVAGAQEFGDAAENGVRDGAGRAIEHEQAAGATRRRLLRDLVARQLEVEIRNVSRRGRRRTCRDWSGLSPPGSASTDRRAAVQALANVVDAEVLDVRARLDLVPRQRHRHGGLRLRADRIDARQRLAPGVLSIVHQHAAAGPDRLAGTRRSGPSGSGPPAPWPAPW